MATDQTPKIAKGITQDMLVSVYKPIGTGENSEVFAGTIADLKEALGIESSYLSYTALLTQTGTDDPTATVLKNNTGLTWTPSYDDVGNYFLTPSVEPNENKVAVFSVNAAATGSVEAFYRNGVINISTKDGTASPFNGILSRSAIEIRIYP